MSVLEVLSFILTLLQCFAFTRSVYERVKEILSLVCTSYLRKKCIVFGEQCARMENFIGTTLLDVIKKTEGKAFKIYILLPLANGYIVQYMQYM